jgi:hypothetical protein
MMGVRMPETRWPVCKRQVINSRNCCILLVDSVESLCRLLFKTPHHLGFRITHSDTPYSVQQSVRHIDLYLTPYTTHRRQKSMPSSGFEPAIPASQRAQTRSHWDRQTDTAYVQKILMRNLRLT